jgi:serine/threonine protein kinase
MTERDTIVDVSTGFIESGLFDKWVVRRESDEQRWIEYSPRTVEDTPADAPVAGLKIHVSAGLTSAGDVLSRVIPILARWGVPFKHAANLLHLAFLSNGGGGPTQIGKFLTAYPGDAMKARELGWELHSATSGLPGPRILSDIPLTEGSLIHFRYGAFTDGWVQLATGRITQARLGENGWESDDRSRPTEMPRLIAASLEDLDSSPHESRFVGSHYVRIQQLYASPRGSTWLGFSLYGDADELVVIKDARAHVTEGPGGVDARSRLRYEAEMLKTLSATGFTPKFLEAWDEEYHSYLIYRLVEGPTLADLIHALAADAMPLPIGVLRDWTSSLCAAIEAVHAAGFVVGDIKPANLIVADAGFQIIDLELAMPPTTSPVAGAGTRGYASPQQFDPEEGRSFADDVYSVGATLLAAALLTDAYILPDSFAAAKYELARDPGNALFATLAKCLDPLPENRPQTVRAVDRALRSREARGRVSVAQREVPVRDYLGVAEAVGNDLCESSLEQGRHRYWESQHPIQQGRAGRDLYAGSSGPALYLCQLYDATLNHKYLEIAESCGRWLAETAPNYSLARKMPGLYFGGCGPGLLYLKLGVLLRSSDWISRAAEIGRSASKTSPHSPDILTGEAGTGLYFLMLAQEVDDASFLDSASACLDHLASTREGAGFAWTIPPDHESLSGNAYLGFSHGTAGIGYFVAEYAGFTGDAGAKDLCLRLATWLAEFAEPNGEGLAWPITTNGEGPGPPYWCHGSGGIMRFLLSAYEATGESWLLDYATGAARMLVSRSSWTGPTQCHGLAGAVESLIDIWQETGNEFWFEQATELAENLMAYRSMSGWTMEYRDAWAPDLLVGEAGIGSAFLRLARPTFAHIVTRQAFRQSRPTTLIASSG